MQAMTLDFRITPGDWLRLAFLQRNWRIRMIVRFAVAAFFAYLAIDGWRDRVSATTIIPICFAAYVLCPVSPLMMLALVFLRMDRRLRIDADGIAHLDTRRGKEQLIPWDAIRSARETRRCFLLSHDTRGSVFIPKRAFSEDSAIADFTRLLSEKLGEAFVRSGE